MLRRLIIMCSVVSACLAITGPSFSQTFARVAAWNQQGVRFDDEGVVHKVNKPAELRTAISAIDADVIALSEVNSRESLDEIDVLVVGDYNMVPTQDQRNFANLSPGKQNNEFLRFISSTLSGPSHIGTCTNASDFTGNLLDGFSISRLHTPEWSGFIRIQQLQALLPNMWCAKYKATISDHLPLVARFRVDGADDD